MPIKQKRFNIFSCVPNRTPTWPAQATMVVGPPGWRSMNSDLGAKLHGLASCLILSVYVYRLDECVCVCSFGCTPFPKLSRSVPTSVAIATVPLWNRPGPLQCHSGAALGENEKHRSAIYWVMVQMEKIQNAGIRCRFRSSGQRQHGKDRCVHCFCIWLGVHVPVFPKLHFIGSGQPIHSGCAFHPVWHIPQGLGCDPIVSEKPFCRSDLIGDGRSKAQCTSKMACCV